MSDSTDYEAAAKAGNDYRAKGIAVSVVDMLICAVTRRHRMTIFTTDPDFEIRSNRGSETPFRFLRRTSRLPWPRHA